MSDSGRVKVRVQLHGFAAARSQGDEFTVDVHPSLSEAISDLREQIPRIEKALTASSFTLLVNGENVLQLRQRSGDGVVLSDGDTLTLIPFVGGG